jgi:hypothetical protein
MTQAFNLSQLANNVDTSGKLNAAAGLYNSTPVPNGGTGLATVTAGRLLLGAGTSNMTELSGTNTGDVVSWSGTAWQSAVASGGALQGFTVATTPGTWTKPATLKGIKVTVIGGGGTSGQCFTSANSAAITSLSVGGGGGGGAAIRLYPAPSLPGPQPYTVGTAASASSFGVAPITVVSATGGSSTGNLSSPGAATVSSNGGGAGGAGSNGNINIQGSPGQPGLGTTGFAFSGGGGSSILGGSTGSGGATAGRNYGGGASGSAQYGNNLGGQTVPGQAGSAGVIIIEEFY